MEVELINTAVSPPITVWCHTAAPGPSRCIPDHREDHANGVWTVCLSFRGEVRRICLRPANEIRSFAPCQTFRALVDGCSDTDVVPKPPWRRRKQLYLERLARESQAVRFVSACDKLHNIRAIIRDYRTHGDSSGRWVSRAETGQGREPCPAWSASAAVVTT